MSVYRRQSLLEEKDPEYPCSVETREKMKFVCMMEEDM